MRVLATIVSFLALAGAAAQARADEAPTPVVPAPVAPAPARPADIAPTAAERRMVVEQMPPTVAPTAPVRTYDAAAVYSPAPSAPTVAVATCSDCFQKRDLCGWAVDNCGNRIGRWDLTLAGMWAGTGSPDGILGEDLFVPGNHLDWNDVDYAGEFGAFGAISYRFEPQSRIEFVGTYYGSPDDANTQSGQFAARPGVTGLGDISRPVDANFDSEAETWSLELNFWTELACNGHWRIDTGIGARYVSFDETAHVDFTTTGPGPFPVADGFVNSEASNDFIGGQICFAVHYDAEFGCDCPSQWEFGASLKALFGSINRDLTVTDDSIFAGGPHTSSEDDDEFVFGVNLDLTAKWKITPHIAVFAGYDLFFLDNVQRAEDGMDFSNSNSGAVQASQSPDQLVIHSLFLGVTFTF